MRIDFKTEGGLAYFPGLSKPFTIDSAALSAAQAQQLQTLVEKARLFERPAARGSTRGSARTRAPDAQRYTITVEDGARQHTVQFADPVTDPDVAALIEFLNNARSAT